MTLAGQSAGALSAIIHASPTSKLFQNLLLMSPPAVNFRAADEALSSFIDFTKFLGCNQNGSAKTVDDTIGSCLSQKTTRQILDANEALTKVERENFHFHDNLTPVIDGKEVRDHPFTFLKELNGLNIIFGMVKDETFRIVELAIPVKITEATSRAILNSIYGNTLTEKFNGLYNQTDKDYRNVVSNSLSDTLFVCPIRKYASLVSSKNRVFVYSWDMPWLGGSTDPIGRICDNKACHTTDLVYLFNPAEDQNVEKKADAFREYLKSFMYAGKDNQIIGKDWAAMQSNGPSVLRVPDDGDSLLVPDSFPRIDQCDFWDQQSYPFESTYEEPSFLPNGIDPLLFLFSLTLYSTLCGVQVIVLLITRFRRNQLTINIERLSIHQSLDDDDLEKSTRCLKMNKALQGHFQFVPKPVSIDITNLDYKVKSNANNETIKLLSDCCCEFPAGTLTALMGPSGSGKTTLLSLVTKRYSIESGSGNITFNGRDIKDISVRKFNSMISYVAQYDSPFVGLTPREVLMYQATLMVGDRFQHLDLARSVAYIIDLLDMSSFADVVITDVGQNQGGLSGGQSRRLSIALGLLKKPSVLILDEPTSGLDAQSSMEVVQVLRNLSDLGYTVIVTIHQPRKEVYEMFSHILLLNHGRSIFSGLRSEVCNVMINLARVLNISTPLSDGSSRESFNVADLVLDIISAIPASFDQSQLTLTKFSSYSCAERKTINCPSTISKSETSQLESHIAQAFFPKAKRESKYSSFILQLSVINARYWRIRPFMRKVSMLIISVTTSILLGVLQRRPGEDLITLSLQLKALVIACVGLSSLKNINISFDYYSDLDLFKYDSANGLVTPFTFFLHRIMTETTTSTVEAIVCGISTYYFLDCYKNDLAIRTVITLIVVYYNCIVSMYVLIYTTRLARPEARSVSFFTQALLIVTSGLWIKEGDTVFYDMISWIQYINPNYWVMTPLIKSVLAGSGECLIFVRDKCKGKVGDLIIEEMRLDTRTANDSTIMMGIIWAVLRFLQLMILHRDRHHPTWTLDSLPARLKALFSKK